MALQFDALQEVYGAVKRPVYGKKGMVCTSQPLAAQAGLDILKKGGNAVDAAIATAAALTVLEPTSNGIGGDCFALVWTGGKLHGLNASGPSPKALTREEVLKRGYQTMPFTGWVPVTVPGLPAGWAGLSERFGRLSLEEVVEPAANYAEEGYPVSPVISLLWQEAYHLYKKEGIGPEFQEWFKVFAPEGRAPRAGELWRSPYHGGTLREIARTKGQAFYKGSLASAIHQFSLDTGGLIRKEDLEAYQPEWVEPISVNYRGYDVWEIPPNGHGIVALMALNILKGMEFTERDNAETIHRQLEAMKLAFADGKRYIADPRSMKVNTEQLLNEAFAAERRRLITGEARDPAPGKPEGAGTVYLCTADSQGNMVSYIQSNYRGFGSGLVVPGTGIALHNRGTNFYMDPASENCVGPEKKPYHTIIPGFLTKDGQAVGPFGVMGAFMQPQGHVQVVMNTVDFHLNPQQALDGFRWQWTEGRTILVEPGFPQELVTALAAKGHDIHYAPHNRNFGRGQIIWRDEQGIFCGGSEYRTDGCVAAW